MKGKIQPAWLQGLLDAATRTAAAEFDKSWKPASVLPEWICAGAPPADRSGANPKQSVSAAFLKRVAALDDGPQSLAELEKKWCQLTVDFPREGLAWFGLAVLQLRSGRLDVAQATCDAALAAGVAAEKLMKLPTMITHARNGPDWTHPVAIESAHYVVKSDIDKQLCVDASKVLEESYRAYGLRLAPVADLEKKRFPVFLFSGAAGYHDYASAALQSKAPSTAGVYSPTLKQLLIWNLPDRAEMFRTIRHEGFHQYLDRLTSDAPIWFDEGMAEYFELADLYGGEWKEGQTHADHVGILNSTGTTWVPLPTLFAMSTRTFQGDDVMLHYAESWAVVHYLRQGPKDAQDRFRRFWSALLDGQDADAATQAAFGDADLHALEAVVKEYVRKL